MNQDLTPVHAFTVVASSIFGAQMAMIIGPYIVIAIGAVGGAAVMIMQREGDNNLRAFVYFVASTMLAVLLTVPLSMITASFWDAINATWLFAPVSFVLGYLGDKWSRILTWGGTKVNSFVDVLIAARGPK